VFFRRELTARNLGFSENEELEIAFNSPHQITVTLRRLRADELKFRGKSGDILCIVTAEKDPPIELCEYFEKTPTPATTPQLEQFRGQIGGELWDYGERTIRLLRWRSGRSGYYNPIRYSVKLEWSLDREHWNLLPYSVHGKINFGFPEPRQIEPFGESVAMMMQQQMKEPLGHELFREAWELRGENPRSALVLGIAAAEVGFKQCVGIVFPDAKELANKNWSPPLKKLLRQYLPQFSARTRINGHALSAPKRWLEILEEGALIRNQIVHRDTTPLPREKLREILGTVHEWLYLLDIYCGHEWAWDRLEVESQRELLAMTQ
jgi:hypothetical protein